MNKLVKGSIAGAAGIALLLGGAGTLALWNADAQLDSTTIESGTMTIATNAAAAAEYADGNAVTATSLIVPGDVITITQPITIAATGDNLEANLSVDTSALVDVPNTVDELGDYVTFTFKAFSGSTEVTTTNMSATTAASIDSVQIVATFAADNEDGQGLSLNLDAVKVLLQQV